MCPMVFGESAVWHKGEPQMSVAKAPSINLYPELEEQLGTSPNRAVFIQPKTGCQC